MSRVVRKRKRRKDYQSKSFHNPFFKNRRKKGSIRASKRSALFIIIIIIILGFSFWFFYISDTFKIKNIEINGLKRANTNEVLTAVNKFNDKKKLFVSQNNLFLLNKNEVRDELIRDFNFSDVNVSKELSSKLIIDITERSYEAILFEEQSYYYIDSEAYVIDKINDLESVNPRKYAIIENESDYKIINNKISLGVDSINFIIEFYNKIKQDSSDIAIEKFIIKNSNSSLSAQVINGPILYLNLDNNPTEQVQNLIILKQNELKEDFFNRSYIDLRYGDRLFLD
jgi:cell division septal protein FtsQ